MRLELQEGEVLPLGFPRFLLNSGPTYERKYGEAPPPMELILVKGCKTYKIEGGFWMEVLK